MDPFYLLDTINNDHNKQKLLNLAQGGATREALTKETICNFPILLPPRELLIRYGHVAGAMHAQRETLALRIETLRRTRDLLLPRLLSGQVELILSKNDS
jgi:type I restriction enzyme S subunit